MPSSASLLLVITAVVSLAAQGLAAKDYCTVQRNLKEEWGEYGKLCRCIYPESLSYVWNGENPSDAKPHCLYNGCPDFERMLLISEGGTFMKDGRPCVCKKGHSKYHTKSVLYHGVCDDLVGDKYEVIFD
ncbi:uncharacterized protein LOC135466257 [Liolophura sinensis]|uniref:uncharacterized protein LOC135466257 n=1 Tax=Liolophura sinensis TaxID=3198878 RepID=UPI003158CB06